ncbi:hypothetical protein Dimus_018607 [Dionaea muscipula]
MEVPTPSIATSTPLRASQISSLAGEEITSIFTATSILTLEDVREMVLPFPAPDYYQFGLPDPGRSVVDNIDRETQCIHLENFTRGLRLPVPYHLVQLLNGHDLLLAQLTPNAISYILAFIILCEDKAVDVTIFLFKIVFSLVEEAGKTGYYTMEPKSGFKLFQDLPETMAISKRKFIIVRNIPVYHEVVNLDSFVGHLLTFIPHLSKISFDVPWKTDLLMLMGNGIIGRKDARAVLLAPWHVWFKVETCCG